MLTQLKRRLRDLSNRFGGANVVAIRQQPVCHAYRVFFRDTVEDIAAWLAGTPVRVMNPAALDKKA